MKKIVYLVLVAFICSCTKQEIDYQNSEVTQTQNSNAIELKLNGKSITQNDVNVTSVFICNNQLNVTATSKKDGVTDDLIVLNLTKGGKLMSVYFVDKSGTSRQMYFSSDFVPSSTVSISGFQFVENKKLKLNFKGQIFKRKNGIFQPNETVQIEGNIDIRSFLKTECNTFNNYIDLSDTIQFRNIVRINDNNKPISTIRYEANSLNGYHIKIDNLKQNINDLPIGTYTFSSNSQTEKIEFRKYIGMPKSFSQSYLFPSDWILYETKGSFSILEKTTINGFKVVKLKLNFTASLNGKLEYRFENADFITDF